MFYTESICVFPLHLTASFQLAVTAASASDHPSQLLLMLGDPSEPAQHHETQFTDCTAAQYLSSLMLPALEFLMQGCQSRLDCKASLSSSNRAVPGVLVIAT